MPSITHREATVQHFMRDPELAELYLQAVLADGDFDEIREVKDWLDEAKTRACVAVEA